MHIRSDTGIDAHGRDIHTHSSVNIHQIKGNNFAVEQVFQLEEILFVFAEGLDKVIACSICKRCDRRIFEVCRAAAAFIEGSVTAAGIDTQFFPGLAVFPYCLDGVLGSIRDIDLERVLPVFECFLYLFIDLSRTVGSACHRVDNKQMLHVSSSLSLCILTHQSPFLTLRRYIYKLHGIIPLYSFLFLSAVCPKNRSKSGWEDSRNRSHPLVSRYRSPKT